VKDYITVSLVVPVYSGADYLEQLAEAQATLQLQWSSDLDCPFRLIECIYVLDEPIDNSEAVLEKLRERISIIRVIALSKNFGQHPATIAGILHSSGDWVATVDEDMQHDPLKIPDLLDIATTTSSDIIYAKPLTKIHESAFRDMSSRIFKCLISRFIHNDNVKKFNSFRLIRGSIARGAASICSHETYFDIALSWFSSRVRIVEFEMKDIRYINTKKSGYSFRKLLSHAWRMLISSRTDTTKYMMFLSAFVTFVSFASGLFFAVQKLLHKNIIITQGWTSLIVTLTFIGGLILFMVSLTLEYISSLILHSQGKPTFFLVDRSGDAIARRFFEGRSGENI